MNILQYLDVYTKRIFFVVAALLFTAVAFEYWNSTDRLLNRYADSIGQYIDKQQQELMPLMQRTELLRQLADVKNTSGKNLELLNSLTNKNYTLLVSKNDSIISSTNSMVGLEFPIAQTKFPALFTLANGQYIIFREEFVNFSGEQAVAWGCIPIKLSLKIADGNHTTEFLADKNIPSSIEISSLTSHYPIKIKGGSNVGFLHSPSSFKDVTTDTILVTIYLLAILLLCFAMHKIVVLIAKQKTSTIGAAVLIIFIFVLRFSTNIFGFSERFSDLPLFAISFYHPFLSSSLGDLIINMVMLLWVMIYFLNEVKTSTYDHLSIRAKLLLTTSFYFSLIVSIIMICGTFKSLALHSNISFDLDNILNLNRYSLLAILSIILLMLSLFLFSQHMMDAIVNMGFTRGQRLISLGFALLLSLPLIYSADLQLPIPQLLLASIFYIGLFDIYIGREPSNFTWLIIWLVIFSSFSAVLLYVYDSNRDLKIRLAFAKNLSEENQISLEQRVQLLRQRMDSPFPKSVHLNFESQLEEAIKKDEYLNKNFIYVTHKIANNSIARFNLENTNKNFSITLNDSIHLQFIKLNRTNDKVYATVLNEDLWQYLPKKYAYAVYRNNTIIDKNSDQYGNQLGNLKLPAVGKNKIINKKNYSELIYRASDNLTVLIGKDTGLPLKPISLFAYLFGLLIIAIGILALINTFTNILPDSLQLHFSNKPTLRGRIQLMVIGLIIITFILIGAVTAIYFKKLNQDANSELLSRQKNSIIANINNDITTNAFQKFELSNLSQIIAPLIQSYRTDINVFNAQGKLLLSSEKEIFSNGIITNQMNAAAYFSLLNNKGEQVTTNERIGDIAFKCDYISIKDINGKIISFLGLPYFQQSKFVQSQVMDFIGALLNAYMFLLLMATVVAIALSNSITNQLLLISEKLKEVKLGKRNQQINYFRQDEIGDLIQVYNNMILQLDESAEKLSQIKREEAWRIMAQQVGHEFNNPLTTMKLNLQQFQRIYNDNPQSANERLMSTTTLLLEEIETLEKISSNFRDFAKMPPPSNEILQLNALVQSTFDFFKQSGEVEMSMQMSDEKLFVFADKDQLKRVLTNLIKNAVQAIPNYRNGVVKVSLYQDDFHAVIKITDNGIGIPFDKKDKIFEPHFTTKNTGTGIGLYMCKSMIELANGRIYFESEPDKFTNFYVSLPLINSTESL